MPRSHPYAAANNPSESFSFREETYHPKEKHGQHQEGQHHGHGGGQHGPHAVPPNGSSTRVIRQSVMPNAPHGGHSQNGHGGTGGSGGDHGGAHGGEEPHYGTPVRPHYNSGHQPHQHVQHSTVPNRVHDRLSTIPTKGPFSSLFNTVVEGVQHAKDLMHRHHNLRAENMSQRAAHHGHLADLHHTMANEYDRNGQSGLAREARRRGDIHLVHHDKDSKIASKHFSKLPKAVQHNTAEHFNSAYHATRAMTHHQRNDAIDLAGKHSAHVAGRVFSPEEREQNRALKNRVMSHAVNRENSIRAHTNYDSGHDRIRRKNVAPFHGENGTVKTLRWRGPGKNRHADLTYAPPKEPGFNAPSMPHNLNLAF